MARASDGRPTSRRNETESPLPTLSVYRHSSLGLSSADSLILVYGGDGEATGADGEATPLEGKFASVSAGSNHTCGLRLDGSVACWGRAQEGQATPPEGEFSSVSAGGSHNCGLRLAGSVACWGSQVCN